MQYKPNLQENQVNANSVLAKGYEADIVFWPKNPKANFLNGKMNISYPTTKDYENKPPRTTRKNKPNSNPIQSQFQTQNKPNMNPKQTQIKPNQAQFFPKPNFSNFHGALQYDAIELPTAVRLDPVQGSVIATNIISGQQRC